MLTNPTLHEQRLARARVALDGLSVGDAFGGFFELGRSGTLPYHIQTRKPPAATQWRFTDDTNMALSIYAVLRQRGKIDQDALAASFTHHFDRTRGYGLGARHLLVALQRGEDWRELVMRMFGGEGSFGNGAAMRVAPLGAYFADDLDAVVEQARLSAEVTHAHPEGIAGAVAVAVAAAAVARLRGETAPKRADFIDLILPHVPEGEVKQGCRKAKLLAPGTSLQTAVAALGNGSRVTAQDTVPLALWCAGEQLGSYTEAIWLTASAGGDVDTTCAMVGGIVASFTGADAIPKDWLARREPLPDWALSE